MLDLSGIPAILHIRSNATLELRNLLIKNIANLANLTTYPYNVSQPLTFVSGMLTWPSFYGEPGSALRIYNTTQYFWSRTLFRRTDCDYKLAAPLPPEEQARPRPCSLFPPCSLSACMSSIPPVSCAHALLPHRLLLQACGPAGPCPPPPYLFPSLYIRHPVRAGPIQLRGIMNLVV
jgi:hypothetical protein